MIQTKDFFRQVEILSSCLSEENLSKADYAEIYNVTEVTISRDINTLRKFGIQIHSKKKKVSLVEKPPKEILIHFCSDYLPLKLNSKVFKEQVTLIAKLRRDNFFQNLITISKAVTEKFTLQVTYRKQSGVKETSRVKPIRLFLNDKNWLLLAVKYGEPISKTFYLSRMESVRLINKKFSDVLTKEALEDKVEIQLEFNSSVENEIYDKIWFDEYTITKNDAGNIILKTSQYISNSLASWCISWWDTIKIIKPKELKEYCAGMIADFKKNNF